MNKEEIITILLMPIYIIIILFSIVIDILFEMAKVISEWVSNIMNEMLNFWSNIFKWDKE